MATAVAFGGLLVLAAVLYAAMLTSISELGRGDLAGQGLAAGYASIAGVCLWLTLAALLLLAFLNGVMPRWAAVTMALALPLSGLALIIAAALSPGMSGWALLTPALLPLLFAGYALVMRFPALAAVSADAVSAIAVGAVTVISVVSVAVSVMRSQPDAAEEAAVQARQAERMQQQQAARDREAADFARLGPDSSLRDYLDDLVPGSSRFQEAIEGARRVKSRHDDAVALLREGRLADLQELWRLDIEPTETLCAAFADALMQEAVKVERGQGGYIAAAMDLERQLPNLRWLSDARCDLTTPLTVLEERLGAISDSARFDQFAAAVRALREKR